MDAAYATAYPDLYRHHWWWRVRETIVLATLRRHLTNISEERPRILDIGCGAGLLFAELDRFGHVEGIESDEIALAQSGVWRDRIFAGELGPAFPLEKRYDIVLMLDLIEHVDDPLSLLRDARQHMTDDATIIVTTPAFSWLWTAHDDINHHRRRYTARQLGDQLRSAGFAAVRTRYLFQSLVMPKLAVRLKEAVMGARKTVPRIPASPLNSVLKHWYVCENVFAGRLPFGSSILATARKRP